MKSKDYYQAQEGSYIFYVYIHRRSTDGKPFYVGKGKALRAWRTDRNNKFWQNVYKKHGRDVDIVFDNLSEEEAFQCERDVILELKYFGYKLTNQTDGGDGPSGYIFSEESRKRMSDSQKTSLKVAESRLQGAIKRRGIKGPVPKISQALKGKKKTEAHRKAAAEGKQCKIIYTFVHHKNEDSFTGNRTEFSEYSGLDRKVVSSLFGARPNSSTKGWSLDSEKD